MKKFNLAIIGSGNIGSRHLQGLSKSKYKSIIHVIDPSLHSLEISRKRISNLKIQATLISRPGLITPKKLPCRVESIQKKANDIAIIQLKLPSSEMFNFLPGQSKIYKCFSNSG